VFLVYFLTEMFTKEKTLNWRTCLLWVMGTASAGLLVRFVTGVGLLHMENPAPEVLGVAASIFTLAVILWNQGMRPLTCGCSPDFSRFCGSFFRRCGL